jgi:hypothetical protein
MSTPREGRSTPALSDLFEEFSFEPGSQNKKASLKGARRPKPTRISSRSFLGIKTLERGQQHGSPTFGIVKLSDNLENLLFERQALAGTARVETEEIERGAGGGLSD